MLARASGRRAVRAVRSGCRTPRPGHWQPLINPANGQPILDPTPWVGGVKPFLIQSSSQFRSAPPPALDSAQ